MAGAAGPPRRGDAYLVALDPTRGSEVQTTRPCLVVSPDELNEHLRTAIVAPTPPDGQSYPWRMTCQVQRRAGRVVLDQFRTVDRERLLTRAGALPDATLAVVRTTRAGLFAR